MALSDVQDLVDNLVRDDSGAIATADRDAAIVLAVERYSSDRPRLAVEDLTGDGTKLLDLPAAWVDDFSAIQAIEYPVGSVPPEILDQDAWDLYTSPSATQIMFLSAPVADAAVRVAFTIKHTLSLAADTIPAAHREAVADWAAALLLDQLASRFSGDSASSIQADVVDHTSKAAEFASRARNLRKQYHDSLGVDPKRSAPAGTVVNLDLVDSRGRDRIFHRRALR